MEEQFENLSAFCMFIGYPRSGSSLVGSLLDAHPEMTIANELDVLRIVGRQRASREQLFQRICDNAREQAEQPGGRSQTGYSYAVPGQWQGRTTTMRVIGDKRAGNSSRRLGEDPGLLSQVRDLVQLPLRLVHITRNPYDLVARISRTKSKSEDSMQAALDLVAGYARTCAAIIARGEFDVLTLGHEALVQQPKAELSRLCEFVGVEPTPGYVDACASIVWPDTNRRRDQIEWARVQTDTIASLIAQYEFFSGYSFTSP